MSTTRVEERFEAWWQDYREREAVDGHLYYDYSAAFRAGWEARAAAVGCVAAGCQFEALKAERDHYRRELEELAESTLDPIDRKDARLALILPDRR